MYSMKEACALTGMTYENLKFYCKEGLVPNVKRDSRNYRVFDDHDIKWIQSLGCLRNCGLSIAEMKEYLHLCLEGESSIPARKDILSRKKEALLTSMQQLLRPWTTSTGNKDSMMTCYPERPLITAILSLRRHRMLPKAQLPETVCAI